MALRDYAICLQVRGRIDEPAARSRTSMCTPFAILQTGVLDGYPDPPELRFHRRCLEGLARRRSQPQGRQRLAGIEHYLYQASPRCACMHVRIALKCRKKMIGKMKENGWNGCGAPC